MEDGPDADLGWCGGKGEGGGAQVEGDLGGQDGHDHFQDEVEGGDAGEQAGQQEQAACNFSEGDKMCCELREGEAQFGKPAYALVGIDKFEEAFPEEYAAGHEADPGNCRPAVYRRMK